MRLENPALLSEGRISNEKTHGVLTASSGQDTKADHGGEVLELLENETGMHSCLAAKPRSPGGTGGKRRHPRGDENTGLGADKPEAQ
jgi:hypothetical protein